MSDPAVIPPRTLVLREETLFVSETPVSLTFHPDTPYEVWEGVTTRLIRMQGRIQWAIGDAIEWGSKKFSEGEKYAQAVEETGRSENTLATIAWVCRTIQPHRRRELVNFAIHREVAALKTIDGEPDAKAQDALLLRAEEENLTRADVRRIIKEMYGEGDEDAIDGQVVSSSSSSADDDELEMLRDENMRLSRELGAYQELASGMGTYLRERVLTSVRQMVVGGEIRETRHDRHCVWSPQKPLCSDKCAAAQQLILRVEEMIGDEG